jgi:competence protein ComFC
LDNVLYRVLDTAPQADIKERKLRLQNMKNVFNLKNPELIKNKAVFLIDDVSTTGATIKEARRVLLNAGAKKILGLVVAK